MIAVPYGTVQMIALSCSTVQPTASQQGTMHTAAVRSHLQVWLQDVAEFTTTCERYVGTESGGMDQAISMMGMPQIAKLIEFNPVRLP